MNSRWRVGLSIVLWLAWSSAWAGCRVFDPELAVSYVGQCKDGLAEGIGIAKGRAEYVGEFKAGRKHGHGVKNWPSGDRYVGEFYEDTKQGMGLYVFGSKTPWAGDSYLGEYRADRRNGRGVYAWANGERYEGTWKDDQMTGPPTAGAIQRGRHLRAVEADVKKVGIKVCRDVAVGIGGKESIAGTVTAVSAKDFGVLVSSSTVTTPVQGVIPKVGEVLRDDPTLWVPCY